MDRGYELKQEVDSCLSEMSLTEQMKRNIRRACAQIEEKSTPKPKKKFSFKPVMMAAMLGIIGASSVMAMDYKLGLGLFFDSENLSHVEDEIQTIQQCYQNGNVRMEVNDAINQGYNAVMTLNLINEGKNEWPKDIEILGFDMKMNGNDWIPGYPASRVLSADGKQLSYVVEVRDFNKLVQDCELDMEVTNLGQTQVTEKNVDIPIGKCATTTVKSAEYDKLKLIEALKEQGSESKKVVLSEEYPTISLLGIGILADTEGIHRGDEHKSGIILQLENSEDGGEHKDYRDYWSDTGNYLTGEITEIMDTRTGKIYKSRNILVNDTPRDYFPEVTAEQIPYLKVVKVEYRKQQVIEEGKWNVSFKMQENDNVKIWEPGYAFEMKIKDEKYTLYVDKISLSTAGIQIKEHTIRERTKAIVGNYNSHWLKIALVLDTGEKIVLENTSLNIDIDENEKHKGYVITYEEKIEEDSNGEAPKRKLIDTKRVKQIIINDKVIDNK